MRPGPPSTVDTTTTRSAISASPKEKIREQDDLASKTDISGRLPHRTTSSIAKTISHTPTCSVSPSHRKGMSKTRAPELTGLEVESFTSHLREESCTLHT
ncbi:hypothetical protein FQR65_LT07183 [Abscondita terminalis]|nr:hypothetical protein FQR65_LT07183 [Abscondita terminalis]